MEDAESDRRALGGIDARKWLVFRGKKCLYLFAVIVVVLYLFQTQLIRLGFIPLDSPLVALRRWRGWSST
jgi:hypothetical protein